MLHCRCLCVFRQTSCTIVLHRLGLQLHSHHIQDAVYGVFQPAECDCVSLLVFGRRCIRRFHSFTFATCNIYPYLATDFLYWLIATYRNSHNDEFSATVARIWEKKNMRQTSWPPLVNRRFKHIKNLSVSLYLGSRRRSRLVYFWDIRQPIHHLGLRSWDPKTKGECSRTVCTLEQQRRNGDRKVVCPKASPPLSRRRPVVAIPGKGVRCQWGQFGMRASPYASPNIDHYIWQYFQKIKTSGSEDNKKRFFKLIKFLQNHCTWQYCGQLSQLKIFKIYFQKLMKNPSKSLYVTKFFFKFLYARILILKTHQVFFRIVTPNKILVKFHDWQLSKLVKKLLKSSRGASVNFRVWGFSKYPKSVEKPSKSRRRVAATYISQTS